MSILGEIGLSEQLVLSYIVGIAGAPAVHPYVQSLVNESWSTNPVLPPPAVVLAQGVAQGQVDHDAAYQWAKEQGFDTAQMDALVDTANVGMALGNAYQSWRRGDLTDDQFHTQLHRLGIEREWWPMLDALKTERLNEGAIATAVHRGIMNDAGLLVTPVPEGSGNVPRIPVSTLDTLAEFAALGIDPERARVLVADTGLPLSLGEMLALYNRGKVTGTDVKVSIAESNVRNEYMDVALDLARRLLTPHEYAEAELRGVLSHAEAQAGAALSGMEASDYETLFQNIGRPLALHQMTTGLARGGSLGGTYSDIPEPYQDAARRSAVRPEYAGLWYANRYSLPSPFVMRALTQAGTWTQAKAEKRLLEAGWIPEDAAEAAAAWAGGTSGAGDANVKSAQTALRNTTHRSYISAESDDATATAALEAAGVDAGSVPAVLALWAKERELVRKQLTPAQIKKAFKEAAINAETQAAWTRDEALAALIARGYSPTDADSFLNI